MIWNVQKHDAALESAVSIAAKLQAAQDIRAMDTSGDNKVDIDEFKSCGGSEAEFKALDINGDGVLDELELRKRGASQIREAENHEQLLQGAATALAAAEAANRATCESWERQRKILAEAEEKVQLSEAKYNAAVAEVEAAHATVLQDEKDAAANAALQLALSKQSGLNAPLREAQEEWDNARKEEATWASLAATKKPEMLSARELHSTYKMVQLLTWNTEDTGLLLIGDPSKLDEETRSKLEVLLPALHEP